MCFLCFHNLNIIESNKWQNGIECCKAWYYNDTILVNAKIIIRTARKSHHKQKPYKRIQSMPTLIKLTRVWVQPFKTLGWKLYCYSQCFEIQYPQLIQIPTPTKGNTPQGVQMHNKNRNKVLFLANWVGHLFGIRKSFPLPPSFRHHSI